MNVNVTKIQRLPNGIIQFYNGTDIIDSFSITSSVSVLFENNSARNISFVSNVKTLSFNVYNITSIIGSTSNKTYTSGIDPSDASSAYISRLYDIYAFIISDVIQGCCPGPTFVGGVVATYPDYASFPATGQESVIYIDESTGVAYFWNGTSYQELISLSASDKMVTVGRNSTGSTLYQGTVIYISGSTGNRPNYVKAQANSEATSAGTFGVILADIANNSDGYAVTIGTIDNLDTRSIAPNPFTSDTLADGDTIYLSPTTAGYVTNVKPYAPSHLVYVGKVVRTSPTNGVIVYRIQNGYELDEIHDVAAQTPSDNDGLFFESSTSLWKNKSISTVLGFTPVPTTRTLTINGTTQDLSANRTFTIATNVGTVTSVAALTLGTTGTDLSSTVANGTSTPVITLNVPTASATNRGALSATDWNTFNNKFSLPTLTAGSILFSNGTTIAQNNANLFWDNMNSKLSIRSTSLTTDALSVHNSIGTIMLNFGAGSVNGGLPSISSPQGSVYIYPNTASLSNTFIFQTDGLHLGAGTSNVWGEGNQNYINLSQAGGGALRIIATGTTNNITLSTNNTERMRLVASTGNVLIGTTTDAGYKLDVNGTARINTLTIGLGGGQQSTNTTCGYLALQLNSSGTGNAAFGWGALYGNTSGSSNSAFGQNALGNNSTGAKNMAVGLEALFLNTTGSNNTAIGSEALRANSSGNFNIANGTFAARSNTTGAGNVASGYAALYANTTGSNNTAEGYFAGYYIADGVTNNALSNNSVYIGANTKALANNQTNQIVIGDSAIGAGSNTATLGNTSIVDTILRGRINIQQYATGSRPTYVKGALIYDSTLGKLVVGGNAGWELVTSA